MKTKKLCALVLSLMLVFSCFAVIPFTASADTPIYVAKLNYTAADSWTYMQTEIPLATGTYQFDVDYYKIGSVTQRVRIDANAGTTEISRTDDGSHITVQFSWVYDGSTAFNLQLRDNNFSGTGVLYFANPVLKEVSGGVTTGDNYVYDFYKQYTDVGATITTDYGWRGKWQRTNTSAAATFTVGTEGNSYFTPLATTATTKAVYIGQSPSGANKAATVFIPLTSKYSGSYKIQDKCTVEFTCKVKVLSGTKPVVGFIRAKTDGKRTVTVTTWVDNSTATLSGDTLTVRFKLDDIPGDANCYKSEQRNTDNYQPNVSYGTGGTWGALTIGNTAFNNNWSRQPDWSGSYIISNPSLKAVLDKDGNDVTASNGEMLAGFDQYNTVGIYGLAGRTTVGNNTDAMNHPLRAPFNKWSILGNDPDLVKFVTVDDSYTVANRTYVQHAETATTREYYTCADFDGVKFEKFGTGCYSVIPDDVNKKAVIIGNDGTNKLANIYLPLFTHRYFQCTGKSDGNYDWRDGYTSGTAGGNIFYHISFKAKRLSGSGQPTLGRLYGADWGWNDSGFRAGGNAAYNGSGDATARPTDANSVVNSTYNASTGEFTAVVRFNKGYFYQMTEKGYNEVLTIGNAEHASSGYDTDNRDSSFAITDISIQVYDSDNSTLLDAEAAPQMVVGNYWFDPSETEIDDHTSQHYYEESVKSNAGRPVALYNNMPLDTWGCDGSQAMISVVNRSDCLAANHTVYYHAATDTTMEYWSCTTCRKCYADPYASEEISDVSATQKMIVVEASGSVAANAFLPLAMPSSAGTHYYKFTCDMKVYGDEAPKINLMQGSWWGGNGAKMPDDTWAYNSDEPDGNGLYAYYDPDEGKYEAVIRIDHSSSMLAYSNALTGAYAGIMLGNGRHVGNGYTDTAYFTSFAFTNPELYELSDPQDTDSVISGNLAAPVTDKTVNFASAYSALAAQRYNTEWTMYSANNLLAAPLGKWSIDYSRSWVKSADVPEDFFTADGAENYMLHFGGTAGNYNYIVRQDFLKQGATYQFDIDYRETSSPARIAIEVADDSSYSVYSVSGGTLTETADNVPGAHKSVRFTVPVNARTAGDGNFRLSLGQCVPSSGIQKSTNNVYFANASLRKVDDSDSTVLGENLLMNGSFQYGSTGGLTNENYENAITYWQSYTANNMPNILIPQTEEIMTIPENFFEGVLGQYATDKAVKIHGQDWMYLRACVELEAGATYRLTYLYRCEDDLMDFAVTSRGHSYGYTVTNNYMKTGGKFKASYDITTNASMPSNGNQDPNTWIDFRNGANTGSDRVLYLSDVRLQKLVGGVPTGSNLLGDYNPVYDDTFYPNDENTTTFSGDTNAAVGRHLVHNWLTSKSSSNGAVVKVNENFFNYYTGAQKLTFMKQKLLGANAGYNPYVDTINPYTDPNGDGADNILDVIRLKKEAAITDEGGAGYEANELKNKIMNAGNIGTAPAGKKTYYVSNSGSDSNNGTSTSTPYATISKAISKATSGDYILLKRGDTWRNPGGASNYDIPAGVTLGSYGTGNKPLIIGSQKNYAGSSNWTNVSGNIWRTKIPGEIHDESIPGTVFFFDDYDGEPTLIGRIIKQTNTASGSGDRFASYSELEKEGDVYYATGRPDFTGYVYVYSVGNPGSKYSRIEIPEKSGAFDVENGSKIDNIAIKYIGGHGIVGARVSNVTVTNCEIGYVGGTPNSSETMGNGIQFGLGGSNLRVENCYVYECFDAGITFQSWGTAATTFDGVYFRDNLLTNNFYNIEFWTTGAPANKSSSSSGTADGTMRNIYITGNIMRFAGECFSYEQRQDTALRAANIMVTTGAYYVNTSNLNITDNIFDCTMVSQITWFWQNLAAHSDKETHVGVNISGNTYFQKEGSRDGRVNRWRGSDSYSYAGSTSTLRAAVEQMDTNPKRVAWVNREDRV